MAFFSCRPSLYLLMNPRNSATLDSWSATIDAIDSGINNSHLTLDWAYSSLLSSAFTLDDYRLLEYGMLISFRLSEVLYHSTRL